MRRHLCTQNIYKAWAPGEDSCLLSSDGLSVAWIPGPEPLASGCALVWDLLPLFWMVRFSRCWVSIPRWSVGFGPSGEIVVWDQGDEGGDAEYSYPRGVSPHPMPLDWVMGYDEDEDSAFGALGCY
jgi:hypothetical protein